MNEEELAKHVQDFLDVMAVDHDPAYLAGVLLELLSDVWQEGCNEGCRYDT